MAVARGMMFLGLDIGTSGVKAVLVDEMGAVFDQATSPLAVSRPHPQWSEQDPADWWRAVGRAVAQLAPQARRRVKAIGLAGQMHGATLLDAKQQVVRPAILWNDGRSEAECAQLLVIEPATHAITGNPVMAGFTAPKLLWVRAHEPDLFAATRLVLLPKDYVRLLMTGAAVSDMSDASGTLWLDVGGRRWSDAMLDATGLTTHNMPALCEGSAPAGRLRANIAQSWGMDEVPVAGGGGDNAAAAVGLGVIAAGSAVLSLGTSGVIFLATDRFRPNPAASVHAFAHALPDRWHQMSVMLSAASCLNWAAALLGLPDSAAVVALAEQAGSSDGVIFLPYLNGERTPHGDPAAKGVIFGLGATSTPGHVAHAVLEGVAMGLRDGLDALTDAGSAVGPLQLAGGGTRSLFWIAMIAAALDRPLLLAEGADLGPAYGAARLARLALTGEPPEQVCAPPAISRAIAPDPAARTSFVSRQAVFRSLYAGLRPLFRIS